MEEEQQSNDCIQPTDDSQRHEIPDLNSPELTENDDVLNDRSSPPTTEDIPVGLTSRQEGDLDGTQDSTDLTMDDGENRTESGEFSTTIYSDSNVNDDYPTEEPQSPEHATDDQGEHLSPSSEIDETQPSAETDEHADDQMESSQPQSSDEHSLTDTVDQHEDIDKFESTEVTQEEADHGETGEAVGAEVSGSREDSIDQSHDQEQEVTSKKIPTEHTPGDITEGQYDQFSPAPELDESQPIFETDERVDDQVGTNQPEGPDIHSKSEPENAETTEPTQEETSHDETGEVVGAGESETLNETMEQIHDQEVITESHSPEHATDDQDDQFSPEPGFDESQPTADTEDHTEDRRDELKETKSIEQYRKDEFAQDETIGESEQNQEPEDQLNDQEQEFLTETQYPDHTEDQQDDNLSAASEIDESQPSPAIEDHTDDHYDKSKEDESNEPLQEDEVGLEETREESDRHRNIVQQSQDQVEELPVETQYPNHTTDEQGDQISHVPEIDGTQHSLDIDDHTDEYHDQQGEIESIELPQKAETNHDVSGPIQDSMDQVLDQEVPPEAQDPDHDTDQQEDKLLPAQEIDQLKHFSDTEDHVDDQTEASHLRSPDAYSESSNIDEHEDVEKTESIGLPQEEETGHDETIDVDDNQHDVSISPTPMMKDYLSPESCESDEQSNTGTVKKLSTIEERIDSQEFTYPETDSTIDPILTDNIHEEQFTKVDDGIITPSKVEKQEFAPTFLPSDDDDDQKSTKPVVTEHSIDNLQEQPQINGFDHEIEPIIIPDIQEVKQKSVGIESDYQTELIKPEAIPNQQAQLEIIPPLADSHIDELKTKWYDGADSETDETFPPSLSPKFARSWTLDPYFSYELSPNAVEMDARKRRTATLDRDQKPRRRRLRPQPSINDDHNFPNSVTPSKIDHQLDTRSRKAGLPDGTYDVPYIDDDAFLPKRLRTNQSGNESSSDDELDESIYWKTDNFRPLDPSHLADMNECVPTPELTPKVQSKKPPKKKRLIPPGRPSERPRNRWLELCSCMPRRRRRPSS